MFTTVENKTGELTMIPSPCFRLESIERWPQTDGAPRPASLPTKPLNKVSLGLKPEELASSPSIGHMHTAGSPRFCSPHTPPGLAPPGRQSGRRLPSPQSGRPQRTQEGLCQAGEFSVPETAGRYSQGDRRTIRGPPGASHEHKFLRMEV